MREKLIKSRELLFQLVILILFTASGSFAQLSITNPAAGNERISTPEQFHHQVWNNMLDMNDQNDISRYINQEVGPGIDNVLIANGQLSFDIVTIADAYFYVYSPGQCLSNPTGVNGLLKPIDTSKYRYLSFHYESETIDEVYFVMYTGCGSITNFRRFGPVRIDPGSRSYTVDLYNLSSITDSDESRAWQDVTSGVTGLRFDVGGLGATAEAPLERSIDWIMLTGDGADYTVNYTANAQGANTNATILLDADSNPFNGYHSILAQDVAATGADSITMNSRGVFPGDYLVCGYLSNDWSTLVNVDGWDMNVSTDIANVVGSTGTVTGGAFSGTTTDALNRVELNLHNKQLNGSVFDTVCFEANLSQAGQGAVLSDLGNQTLNMSTGTNTYTVDMSAVWNGNGNIFAINFPGVGNNFSLNWVSIGRNGSCASSDVIPQISCAPGTLIANSPPTIEIMQPDVQGGVDFASVEMQNPWNYGDREDVREVQNSDAPRIYPNNFEYGQQGDFFCSTSIVNNDDPYNQTLAANQGYSIDTSKYTNLTIRLYQDAIQDETFSSVLRIIPCDADIDGQPGQGVNDCWNGDDTFYVSGNHSWVTISQDMTKWKVESILHPTTAAGEAWASGNMESLRVDIQEPYVPITACVDYLRLTEDDAGNSKFALTLSMNDSDSVSTSVDVDCFRSTTDGATSGGTPIPEATDISLASNDRIVELDLSAWPNGTYYIYCTIQDGFNSHTFTSHRLKVDHTRSQDSTAPALSVDYPVDQGTEYKASGMVVAGWAVDEIDLALVTVRVDGQYLTSFDPRNFVFNKEARDAYPTYSRASNAGFFETVDINSLSVGAHTVQVEACDTGNNCTAETFAITVQNGSNPNPPQPSAPENESPLPAGGGTDLTLDLDVSKDGQMSLSLTNADLCQGDIVLKGHFDKKQLSGTKAVQVFSLPQSSAEALVTLSASNLPKMKPVKNKKKPGKFFKKIFIGAFCNGATTPTATAQYPASKKGASKKRGWKALLNNLGLAAN